MLRHGCAFYIYFQNLFEFPIGGKKIDFCRMMLYANNVKLLLSFIYFLARPMLTFFLYHSIEK